MQSIGKHIFRLLSIFLPSVVVCLKLAELRYYHSIACVQDSRSFILKQLTHCL